MISDESRKELDPAENAGNEAESADGYAYDKKDKDSKTEKVKSASASDEKQTAGGSVISGFYDIVEMVAVSLAIVIFITTFLFRYSKVDGDSMNDTIKNNDCVLVSIAGYTPKNRDIVVLQAPDYTLSKPLIKRVIATEGQKLEINFKTWAVSVDGFTEEEPYIKKVLAKNMLEEDMASFGIGEYRTVYKEYNNKPIYESYNSYSTYKADENGTYRDSFGNPVEIVTDRYSGENGYGSETTDVYYVRKGEALESVRQVKDYGIYSCIVPEGTVFVMGDNRNNSHDSRSTDIGFVDTRWIVGKATYRIYPFDNMGKLG